MLRSLCLAAVAALFACMPGGGAGAADKIGITRTVVSDVSGRLERTLRRLAAGDQVFRDEVIMTEPQASTLIVLDDDTTLSLGSSTELVLDEFVYRGEQSSGQIVLGATRGALRFITGKAAKDSYRIVTPTAILGFRGTDVDTYVDRYGTTLFLLRDGGARACRGGVDNIWAAGAGCVDLDQALTYVVVNALGIFGPVPWTGQSISDVLFANRPISTGPSGQDGEDPVPDTEPESQEEEDEETEG